MLIRLVESEVAELVRVADRATRKEIALEALDERQALLGRLRALLAPQVIRREVSIRAIVVRPHNDGAWLVEDGDGVWAAYSSVQDALRRVEMDDAAISRQAGAKVQSTIRWLGTPADWTPDAD